MLGVVSLVGCSLTFEDREVMTLPPEANEWWFSVARDGRASAYATREGARVFLVVGDRRSGPYV